MPLTTFSPQNKVQTSTEYPKLKLDFQERALVNCFDPNPVVEYTHTLRAPELGPDGKIMKEVKKNNKGEEYEANVYEFVGQHICFGDFNTVADNGVDPDSCPTCRAAVEEEGIQAPLPRYAMNVLRYVTQPGGWQLRDPYGVNVEAWVFSATRFNTIVDLSVDADGDLRKHDLRLGPCENKNYQKFDIHVVPAKAHWMADKAHAQETLEIFEKNKCDDLSALIGRKIDKTKALEDIQKVIEKTQAAYGRGPSVQVPDLSNVRNESSAPVDGGAPFDVATPGEAAAAETFSVDTATGEVTEEKKGLDGSMSLDDLLAEL